MDRNVSLRDGMADGSKLLCFLQGRLVVGECLLKATEETERLCKFSKGHCQRPRFTEPPAFQLDAFFQDPDRLFGVPQAYQVVSHVVEHASQLIVDRALFQMRRGIT